MPPPERIAYIDAWRFFAVGMVIVAHYLTGNAALESWFPSMHYALNHLGLLGVLIFFCISGYVITQGLINERRQTGDTDLAGFYIRRALRILPPLVVYLFALVMADRFRLLSITPVELLRTVTFTCNLPLASTCSWFTAHTWSLAYEEQFYLLFPLGLASLAFVERPIVLVAIVAAMMVVAVLASMTSALHFGSVYLGYFIYLLTGCVAALYGDRLADAMRGVALPIWIAMGAMLFALIVCIRIDAPWSEPVFSMLCPVLVCLVVIGTPIRNRVVRSIFEHRLICYLGKISYTVYLWQQLVMRLDLGLGADWVPVLVVGIFVFAHFSYRYLEKPFMRLGRRLASRRSVPHASLQN